LVDLGSHCIKMVEYRPILSTTDMLPKNLVYSNISFMAIFAEGTENKCIIDRQVRDVDLLCHSL